MRSRIVKPGFFDNPELAECSAHARLLFIGLWCIADREGRFKLNVRRIRAQVFPYELDVPIDDLFAELTGAGFVCPYRVNGSDLAYIPTFTAHQHIHRNEAKSALPSPEKCGNVDTLPALSRECQPTSTSTSVSTSTSTSVLTCVSDDEEVPKEVRRFIELVKVWETVIGAIPSEATKRTLRSWATMGYSDSAATSALKAALENKARVPAQYATTVLRNGQQEKSEDDDYLKAKYGGM